MNRLLRRDTKELRKENRQTKKGLSVWGACLVKPTMSTPRGSDAMDVDRSDNPDIEKPSNQKFAHDVFLSKPRILKSTEEPEKFAHDRTEASYEPNRERFSCNSETEGQQFFNIYNLRSSVLKPTLVKTVEARLAKDKNSSSTFDNHHAPRWSPIGVRQCVWVKQCLSLKFLLTMSGPPIVDKILHTRLMEECVLIGTIIKEMPLRPNVLKEYSQERAILEIPANRSFISDKDALILEDETGRVKLVGNTMDAAHFVTGILAAVRGKQIESGDFEVYEFFPADIPPQQPLPTQKTSANRYVALVSGLNIGSHDSNPLLPQLLSDYISGHAGSLDEEGFVATITRLIIAGNSFCSAIELPGGAKLRDTTKKFKEDDQYNLVLAVKELDRLLVELATSVPVDLMPGGQDPSNFALPQQPLSQYLLPRSSALLTMNMVTNPYEATIDGVTFLGHSGQPTDDIQKYMKIDSVVDLLENTLQWQHMAPLAPDATATFAFVDRDPFALTTAPHVYFAGNQPRFETRLVEGPQGQKCHPVQFEAWDSSN